MQCGTMSVIQHGHREGDAGWYNVSESGMGTGRGMQCGTTSVIQDGHREGDAVWYHICDLGWAQGSQP